MSSIEGKEKSGGEGSLLPKDNASNTEVESNTDDPPYDNPGKTQQRIDHAGRESRDEPHYENPGKRSK